VNERLRTAPYQIRPPVPEPSGVVETIGAAFRLENDVINAVSYARRGVYEADYSFDIAPLAAQSPLWADYADRLARAQSETEFRSIEARLMQETQDRQILAGAGWGGIVAGLGAGLLSPTMFIPMVGGARGVRGVAQAVTLAAGAATAAELPMIANQLTRTGAESAINIAAGTVLGGLLGGTAVWLRSADRARLARDLEPDAPQDVRAVIVRNGDGSVSRVGENVPLRLPAGTVRSPQAAAQMQQLQRGFAEVNQTIAAGDLPALRALVDSPNAQPLARELAQEILNRASPARVASMAAEAEGIPPEVITAFAEASRIPGPEGQAVMGQVAERVGPEQFARLQQMQGEAQGPVRSAQEVADEIRAEREAPLFTTREEADGPRVEDSTTGAKRREDQFTPMLRQVDPVTGESTYIPLIDPDDVVDPGGLANSNAVLRTLGRTSPIIAMIEQQGLALKSNYLRRVALQLSDSGLSMEGSRFGIAPAPGGTVEARVGMYEAYLGNALKFQYEAYHRYLGRADSFADNMMTRAQVLANRTPTGRLSFSEFKEQVADAMNTGDRSAIKEVSEVAANWRTEFFGKFNEAMLDATEGRGMKALYSISDDPDESYFTHVFSLDKISADREGFIQMVADHYQSAANAVASRRWQKLQQNVANDEEAAELLALDADGARLELDTVNDALEQLRQSRNPDPIVEQISRLYEQRRLLRDEEFDKQLANIEARLPDGKSVGPEDTAAAKRLASQSIREQYQELTDEIRKAEASLTPETLASRDAERRLRARKRNIERSFGRLEARQQELADRIAANDERNLAALERFETRVRTLDAQLGRIDDAKLDKELARLEAQFDKLLKQMEDGDARIQKLQERFGPIGSENEPTERLSIENARQAMRAQRADNALTRFGEAADYDREGARQALRDRLTASREYVNRVNSRRAATNERMRQRLENLDPQLAARRAEELRTRAEGRDDDFRDWLAKAGADDYDLEAGTFDFAKSARALASDLSYKITGNPRRAGQIDMLPELKGPMKRRVLDIDYAEKRAFLELDTEKVAGRYMRSVGSDIEVYRAFGSVNEMTTVRAAEEDMAEIERMLRTREVDEEGVAITPERRAREVRSHARIAPVLLNKLQHTFDRIRGYAGMPSDPMSMWYRIGRSARNLNVPIMMGSAMVTSIPDVGRPVMTHGLMNTFGHAWKPLIAGLVNPAQREINRTTIRQLNYLNVGLEMFTQSRAQGGFDFMADGFGYTRLERGIEWLAQKTPQVALFGAWTDANKVMAGMVTMARLMTGIEDAATGRLTADSLELRYMAEVGITPQLAERIAAQYDAPGGSTMVNGTRIATPDQWTDYEALRAFGAAMHRESNRIIITPGLERPMWMDQTILGQVVGQFRSFTMASNSKILMSGLQSRDMALYNFLTGTVFSLAMGTVSYYIWANTAGERQRQEMLNASWETWLDQAIYRSGVLGALSIGQDIGSTIPATAPYVSFKGGALSGRRPTSVLGAVTGPSYGTAETIASVLQGLDSPTQSTLSQARKLIPYQNVFYLRRALDMVEEGVGNMLGLPERR